MVYFNGVYCYFQLCCSRAYRESKYYYKSILKDMAQRSVAVVAVKNTLVLKSILYIYLTYSACLQEENSVTKTN